MFSAPAECVLLAAPQAGRMMVLINVGTENCALHGSPYMK